MIDQLLYIITLIISSIVWWVIIDYVFTNYWFGKR